MGSCLKGKAEIKNKEARFTCTKCGADAAKKGHLCKPEKVTTEKNGQKESKKRK